MRGLKLGVLVFSALLVFGCSNPRTKLIFTKELNEKLKKLREQKKRELILNKNQRGNNGKNLYPNRKEYINNSKAIPLGTTDPVLVNLRALIYSQNPRNYKDGHLIYKEGIFDYNGTKPDENKIYDDPDTQMAHRWNIIMYPFVKTT